MKAAVDWLIAILIGLCVGWAIVRCSVARAHDPYTGIFNFSGVNCCTGQDCQAAANPADIEPIKQGYRIKSTNEVVPLAQTGFSPDRAWHICRKSDSRKTIRCLLVPESGS